MKSCEMEEAVLAAAQGGIWDESLRSHVAGCLVCADALLVNDYLQGQARSARAEAAKELPSPGLIWWKAQILAKRETVERATRPILVFEKFAYLGGALSLVGLAIWNWPAVEHGLAPLRAAWVQMSSLGATPFLNPFLYLSAGFLALLVLLIFALYVVWAEI